MLLLLMMMVRIVMILMSKWQLLCLCSLLRIFFFLFKDNFQKLMQVQCSLNGHHEIVQPGRVHVKLVWWFIIHKPLSLALFLCTDYRSVWMNVWWFSLCFSCRCFLRRVHWWNCPGKSCSPECSSWWETLLHFYLYQCKLFVLLLWNYIIFDE